MWAPNTPAATGAWRLPARCEHVIEQVATEFGRRSAGESRPRALARVRGERELWHQQEAATDRLQVEVHLAFPIGEHAQREQPVDEAIGIGVGVRRDGTHEDQKAGADGADGTSVHVDPGRGDPLQKGEHRAGQAVGGSGV